MVGEVKLNYFTGFTHLILHRPKISITTKILIAMGVGLALGILLNGFASDIDFVQTYIINGLFHVVGKMFIKA